ncbi:MAG TPA: NfeD family protein [Planctomycetota bacterium]
MIGTLALLLSAAAQDVAAPAAAPARVVVVPIHGPIDTPNLALVRRAIKEMGDAKPALVIFEIDTPGGRVDHTLAMGEAMTALTVPTAAFIRPAESGDSLGAAWSAGAFLALSCKKLYMYPGTVIGAAAVVQQGPEGATAVEEKYVSGFREKFRARAEQNGYPPNLAVAMVDRDLEVFEVLVDGKKLYLTVGEIDKIRGEGKTFDVPRVPFDSKDKLLTLTDRQVVDAGMGKIVRSREEIWKDHGLAAAAEIHVVPSWSENFVGFITSGGVAMILLVIGVVGLWIEFKTPGFGVPGVLGAVCLLLFFFGHSLAGLAEATDIVLFAIGVGLVLVEILLLPTGGILAILGAVCAAAGLILSLQGFTLPDTQGAPWEVDVLLSSVGRTLTSLATASVLFLFVLRFLPKVPVANRLVLQTELVGAAPGTSTSPDLAGRHGHATTPLRPGGKISVDGQILDVVAEGEFIAQGEPVEILRVEGMRIVVARTKR